MSLTAFRRSWLLALALAAGHAAVAFGIDGVAPDHDLEVVPPVIGSPVEPGSTIHLRIEVSNKGRIAWSAETGFALAYHWIAADGEVVVWDGDRSTFPEPLKPGESRTIDATIHTPERAGRYGLQWDVVQEGTLWVSEVDPSPVEHQSVEVAATHAYSLLRVAAPRILRAGGERGASLVVRNDGTAIWPGDASVSIAYHWFDAHGEVVAWEGRRKPVTRPVAPGETIEVETVVRAPDRPGRLFLGWDMVEEGVCWFSERDASSEPSVVVVVLPAVVVTPVLWSVLVVVAAALAVARGWRPASTGTWPRADVVWCVAAIVVKQMWVLSGADLRFSAVGWWLTGTTAILIGLALLALPVRIRPWLAWVTAATLTAILFADVIHQRFFGDLISVAGLHAVGQIGRVGASVRSLLVGGDLWFWADLPAALVLVWAVSRMPDHRSPRRWVVAALGLAVAAAGAFGAAVHGGSPVSHRQVFQTTRLARQIGVLNLHALDLTRSTARMAIRPELAEEDYLAVVEYFDDRRPLRAGTGEHFGAARDRNLLMIQVESLQAFVIGFEVGGREVTPFLNDFAADGYRFGNVTDQTEEGRSSDSELATQVSLLPPDRGAAAFLHADNDYTGVASVLAESGYHTLSAVPFEASFWNRRVTHGAYGFDRSVFGDEFAPDEAIGWGLNDRAFLTQAAGLLGELPEPWCSYLLTLSLHHPFDGFPEHLKRLDVGAWEGTPFGNFLHTMHHFDRALGDLVTELEAAGLMESTVLAIWGDHDAGFEWRSEIAAAMGVPHTTTGWYLSQQIPLVIRVPGHEAQGEVFGTPAGHADVAPTLLALLGHDPSGYAFVGRNLLGSPGPGPVVGEYRCWRDATHLYLRRGPELADGDCIELESMMEVDTEACAAGFEKARRQVEISSLVLEHDLQARLWESLGASP